MLALTLGSIAVLSRVIRLEVLRVLDEDYIRTARSKRLPARIVYIRHALPNMLTASLTISGLFLAGLVAGTVLVENVFAWPGIGSTVVRSVIARDYPIALTLSLLLGGDHADRQPDRRRPPGHHRPALGHRGAARR